MGFNNKFHTCLPLLPLRALFLFLFIFMTIFFFGYVSVQPPFVKRPKDMYHFQVTYF